MQKPFDCIFKHDSDIVERNRLCKQDWRQKHDTWEPVLNLMFRSLFLFLMFASSKSNKDTINLFYFSSSNTGNVWQCQYGTAPTQRSTGFFNLLQHLKQKHTTHSQWARARALEYGQYGLSSFLYWSTTTMIYSCLCYITNYLWPADNGLRSIASHKFWSLLDITIK